jgi:hypothetical protein
VRARQLVSVLGLVRQQRLPDPHGCLLLVHHFGRPGADLDAISGCVGIVRPSMHGDERTADLRRRCRPCACSLPCVRVHVPVRSRSMDGLRQHVWQWRRPEPADHLLAVHHDRRAGPAEHEGRHCPLQLRPIVPVHAARLPGSAALPSDHLHLRDFGIRRLLADVLPGRAGEPGSQDG